MEEIKKEFEDLITTKTFLKGAINEKGGTITDDTPFSEYPNQVRTKTGNVLDTLNITENGRFDTKDYKSVNVGIVAQGDEVLIDLSEGDITELTIPYGATKITDYAFDNLKNLINVTIPETVTKIGSHAFEYCFYITNIEIPDSVTKIDIYAFANCQRLKTIKLSNQIAALPDYVFYLNAKLESIEIPDSVITIGNYAFNTCQALESIEIPDSVTHIGNNAFNA